MAPLDPVEIPESQALRVLQVHLVKLVLLDLLGQLDLQDQWANQAHLENQAPLDLVEILVAQGNQELLGKEVHSMLRRHHKAL